ncbi:helix-turn-helix domain-containing protein [Halomonas sp. RA08-2]|uniref:helix-turn-helix domain-containing protein n=1 Tax=Halomonas sp. RA08-2 TaxID=3440842 RepID=UPI003EED6199
MFYPHRELRRLERTEASIEETSWRVGYEDSALFRRLIKRTTGLAPSAYRRHFRIPDFARPKHIYCQRPSALLALPIKDTVEGICDGTAPEFDYPGRWRSVAGAALL